MLTSTSPALELLVDQCAELELNIEILTLSGEEIGIRGPKNERIRVNLRPGPFSMLEQVLRALLIRFEDLPLLVLGDSKEIRLLTPKIALARLIPSAYSFTENRYGTAPGTEIIRARFSAEIFRAIDCLPGTRHMTTAFLGLIETGSGPLLAERVIDPGNLEVRVKRYHIGSPVHRYKNMDLHRTANNGPPLLRWSRFNFPVVCFDWRHPLTDADGKRLSDEPLPDDYASMLVDDLGRAKRLARNTFLWLEDLFSRSDLRLIDICFFIDKTGSVLFGEISPDCMRVRSKAADDGEALDKDRWRSGGTPQELLERYLTLYEIVFKSPLFSSSTQQEEVCLS